MRWGLIYGVRWRCVLEFGEICWGILGKVGTNFLLRFRGNELSWTSFSNSRYATKNCMLINGRIKIEYHIDLGPWGELISWENSREVLENESRKS